MFLLISTREYKTCALSLVLNRSKYDSSTDALKTLHWLQIRLQIMHKIQCSVHKCLYGKAPLYLKTLLNLKKHSRSLRSSEETTVLTVPFTKLKTFASRSFSVKGSEYWNILPKDLSIISDYNFSILKLKTYLYNSLQVLSAYC